ncbi:tyrosine--tRNA ligase [Candidatus Omnitrophota bacterium]
MKTVKEQLEVIKRGAVEIIQEEGLKEKLEKSLKSNKPLVIKAGFDPSAPDIHLGHTVLLRKLKHFQDLGHKVVFLIGDFTGRIGDPSGQSQTRKNLTKEEVLENAKTYEKQIYKILDKKKTEVVFNSSWCDIMKVEDFLELTGKYTVARMLERDDFLKRYKNNKPISMVEFMYPLIQGYDSVVLKADVELGGTDQKFNLLVGRNLQGDYGQEAQIVLTMPLLEGTDGVQKMSKSLGNYIGIEEDPRSIFGKIMSISDELMLKYYELLTDEPLAELKKGLKDNSIHPKDAKKKLAKIIITQYHSKEEADKEDENFEKAFKHKGFPDDVPLVNVKIEGGKADMVTALSIATDLSKSELRRKIKEGAVEINGNKVKDLDFSFEKGTEYKIRIGKKFYKANYQ